MGNDIDFADIWRKLAEFEFHDEISSKGHSSQSHRER
jgi:hypothetical protein